MTDESTDPAAAADATAADTAAAPASPETLAAPALAPEVMKRHADAIQKHLHAAAQAAGVKLPSPDVLKVVQDNPLVQKVLSLLEQPGDAKHQKDAERQGNEALRTTLLGVQAVCDQVIAHHKAHHREANQFVVGTRDAMKHLLKRFAQGA